MSIYLHLLIGIESMSRPLVRGLCTVVNHMATAPIDIHPGSVDPNKAMIVTVACRFAKSTTLPVKIVDLDGVGGRIPLTIWVTPELMINIPVIFNIPNSGSDAPLGKTLLPIGISQGGLPFL